MTGVPKEEREGEKSPKARVASIMQKLDVNKDNYLSLDEFINGAITDEKIQKILIDPLFYCRSDY